MADFFSLHEQTSGTGMLRNMYLAYQLALKRLAERFFFIDFRTIKIEDLEIYVKLFGLEILRDSGVSDENLFLICRNIVLLISTAGTLKCLRILGVIQTGGNAIIFNDANIFDGSIHFDGTKKYGSFIISNNQEIIFVEGDYLITLINGTVALKSIVEFFKSHRDFVQIM